MSSGPSGGLLAPPMDKFEVYYRTAQERLQSLEVAMLGEHGLTLPPETVPLHQSGGPSNSTGECASLRTFGSSGSGQSRSAGWGGRSPWDCGRVSPGGRRPGSGRSTGGPPSSPRSRQKGRNYLTA